MRNDLQADIQVLQGRLDAAEAPGGGSSAEQVSVDPLEVVRNTVLEDYARLRSENPTLGGYLTLNQHRAAVATVVAPEAALGAAREGIGTVPVSVWALEVVREAIMEEFTNLRSERDLQELPRTINDGSLAD